MAVWIPVLKLTLPYVASVATAAIPAFTQRRDDSSLATANQQIDELQKVAASNAEAVRLLAAQLERTLVALDEGAHAHARRARRTEHLALAALAVAALALATSLTLFFLA